MGFVSWFAERRGAQLMFHLNAGPWRRRGVNIAEFGVVLGLTLLVGLVACSPEPVDSPLDAGDTKVENGTDDVGSEDDAEDADTGGDVDAADTDTDQDDGPEEWTGWEDEDCDCPEPDEKCSPDYCGLPDAQCGPEVDSECPDGYACIYGDAHSDAFICVCLGDSEECLSECSESHDECENGICSFDDGHCRWGRAGSCYRHMDCPEGQMCEEPWCEPTGERDVGESCDEDGDCHTGICYDGTCDEQCLGDEDCPEGQRCLNDAHDEYGTGCEPTECNVSCPDHKRCRGDKCSPRFCQTTEDCETGDCWRPPLGRNWIKGWCVEPGDQNSEFEPDDPDVDSYCKPEEIYEPLGHYCYIPGHCWDDDNCDEPYECRVRCTRSLDGDDDG